MFTCGWHKFANRIALGIIISIGTSALNPAQIFAFPNSSSVVMPDNPRYSLRSVGDEVGLDTRGAASMLQDKSGFVWIGTQDGLFRCDGAKVERFDARNGLPDSWIKQIIEGPDSTIWYEAGGEIGYFDGVKFQKYPPPAGEEFDLPPATLTQRIGMDQDGVIYLATESGLWQLQTTGKGDAKLLTKAHGLSDSRCRAAYVDPNGMVWIVTVAGVSTYNPKTDEIRNLSVEHDITAEEGVSLIMDREGTVWLRTLNHLLTLKPGGSGFTAANPPVGQATVMGMPTLDADGNIMVPSAIGLYIRKDDQWTIISGKNGLRGNAVTVAIEDREGELWIGLLGVGVQRVLGRRSWAAWTGDEGLPDNGVWGSMRDKDGRLWVATNNGIAIWQHKKKKWVTIKRADGLVGDRIWKLAKGPQGWVWALSRRAGFNRIHPKTLEVQPVESPIPLTGVPMELTSAPDGSLWLATTDVVVRVQTENDELKYEEVDLPKSLEQSHEVIKFTDNGVTWIGGTHGVGRFDGQKWTHYTPKDGLQNSRVMTLAAISNDEVWAGYYEGVGVSRIKLEGNDIVVDHYGRNQGLASDRVWLLESDLEGKAWIGGSDGLSVIDRKGNIRIFTQTDGLLCNDINQAAFLAQTDGSIIVGTGRGMAYYRPTIHRAKESPPNIALTSVRLGGAEMLQEQDPDIDYDLNTFEAKFAGLTFRNSSKVRYRYRLIGWDPQPIETSQREVRYAALPPGRYTLVVSCRSAAGILSETPATYKFRVLPPWWERWWFRVGALAVLVLLIWGLLLFRTRRLAADRSRLEKAVKERNAQLRQANKELEEMSFTDALTQTRNRRFFTSVIDTDVSSALRKHDIRESGSPDPNRDLLFFIIDLDHFKRVNDIYGHSVGDIVLVETSRRLNNCLRHSDLLVRWGGEEFLILCRDADRNEATAVAKRILDVVGLEPFNVSEDESFHRTCSLGWAAMPAFLDQPGTLAHEDVLELADKALYVAKQSGRNQGVGVEVDPGAPIPTKDNMWLDDPIEKLEGKVLTLTRVEGPDVSTAEKTPRVAAKSSIPPPSYRGE